MKNKSKISGGGLQILQRNLPAAHSPLRASPGFSLIEVLIVVTLLSLIVIALMGVFSSTQRAFRASVTQTDVLEGGRATMDMIAGDLRQLAPSGSYSNGAVNFYAAVPFGYTPLIQRLVGGSDPRTNILEKIFVINRLNQTWTGVGYVVDANSASPINPLYRFTISTNAAAGPGGLYLAFSNAVVKTAWTNMSHLLDGVVHLRVRAYDTNGIWMDSFYTAKNFDWFTPAFGETGFFMYSNTLPGSVEIELGTLEDRTLQRAESLPNNLPALPPNDRRTLYLNDQAGKVHIFRQRVSIPNADQ